MPVQARPRRRSASLAAALVVALAAPPVVADAAPSPGAVASPDASSRVNQTKCAPALIGWGIPLIALLPLGIAMQLAVPGFESVKAGYDAQLQAIDANLIHQLRTLNPALGAELERLNVDLGRAGAGLAQAAVGLAVVGFGAAVIADLMLSCMPGDEALPAEEQSSRENFKAAASS